MTAEGVQMFKQWIEEGAKENPSDTFVKPQKENVSLAPVISDEKLSLIDQLGKRLKPPSKPQLLAAQKSGALVTLLSTRHSWSKLNFLPDQI